jgi:response regulator of citrate/malate metabolism
MSKTRDAEKIAAVVEMGMTELSAKRFENAGKQFELAGSMCSVASQGTLKLAKMPAPKKGAVQRDPRYSSSLEIGMRVLACFSEKQPMWGIAELSDAVGVSRSTVHRYCSTLVKLGQITQEGVAARKYVRVDHA